MSGVQSVRERILRMRLLLNKCEPLHGHAPARNPETGELPIAGVMFASEAGTPLDLKNVFNRRIEPILNACAECGETKKEHAADADHEYRRRTDLPEWHGWHALRRGLGSNLNELGVPDLTIQRILRHSNVTTTRKSYIKIREDNVTAGMAQLEAGIRRAETAQSEAETRKAERPN